VHKQRETVSRYFLDVTKEYMYYGLVPSRFISVTPVTFAVRATQRLFHKASRLKGLISESVGADPRVLHLENIRACRQLHVLLFFFCIPK